MNSKAEICNGLTKTMRLVTTEIEALSNENFIIKPNSEKWCIAEEFDHILKSNTSVASALKRNPLLLKCKFGRPNRPLRNYEEVCARYNEKLVLIKGVVAPAQFISQKGQVFNKKDMLSHWTSTSNKLNQRTMKWSDNNLDTTLLPHPLLGKMMVREMLFFLNYHTLHHLEGIRKKIKNL